jgi:hypothetical protein
MAGYFPIVKVSDASKKRRVPVLLRPLDCLVLGLKCRQHMVGMVLNHVVVNWITFTATFWTRFYINVCHSPFPLKTTSKSRANRVVSQLEFWLLAVFNMSSGVSRTEMGLDAPMKFITVPRCKASFRRRVIALAIFT